MWRPEATHHNVDVDVVAVAAALLGSLKSGSWIEAMMGSWADSQMGDVGQRIWICGGALVLPGRCEVVGVWSREMALKSLGGCWRDIALNVGQYRFLGIAGGRDR